MKTYYFVAGPRRGHEEAFFRRLAEVGGSPPDWRIYPHATGDGRALHVVEAESEAVILAHLRQFNPTYRRGPIVEVHPGPT
jgi:hypothetical protein